MYTLLTKQLKICTTFLQKIVKNPLCLCRAHINLVLNPIPWPDDSSRHPDILFIF